MGKWRTSVKFFCCFATFLLLGCAVDKFYEPYQLPQYWETAGGWCNGSSGPREVAIGQLHSVRISLRLIDEAHDEEHLGSFFVLFEISIPDGSRVRLLERIGMIYFNDSTAKIEFNKWSFWDPKARELSYLTDADEFVGFHNVASDLFNNPIDIPAKYSSRPALMEGRIPKGGAIIVQLPRMKIDEKEILPPPILFRLSEERFIVPLNC